MFYYYFMSEGPMIPSLGLTDLLEQLTEFRKNSLLIIKDLTQEQPDRRYGAGVWSFPALSGHRTLQHLHLFTSPEVL